MVNPPTKNRRKEKSNKKVAQTQLNARKKKKSEFLLNSSYPYCMQRNSAKKIQGFKCKISLFKLGHKKNKVKILSQQTF